MTILIIKTGDALPEVKAEHGDFEDWFEQGLGVACRTVDVVRDQPLPSDGYNAVVITGSPAMVTERLGWSERTARWLRRQSATVPMLGVCYGHQLLAYAFGGAVGDNPNGRQIGTIEVNFEHHQGDGLIGDSPSQLMAQASHVQSVLEVPNGAKVLASSPRDPNHVIHFHDRVWGIQFHPEWNEAITTGYLRSRRTSIEAEGQDVDKLLSSVTQSDRAAAILRSFAQTGMAHFSRSQEANQTT